ACIVILLVYSRSVIQYPEIVTSNLKHTLNMCQVYAFGYQERHPEWKGSPWTECYGLMQSQFGKQLPTLSEMLRSNPRAVFDHFLWNIRLAPNGIQVLLFNATWGTINPDYIAYIPLEYRSPTALALSSITGCTILFGLILLYRERQRWWSIWLHERALGWLAM